MQQEKDMTTHRLDRIMRLRSKVQFNLWMLNTMVKELYYRFFPVPEWLLEDIHYDIEDHIDNHVWDDENDTHGGIGDMLIENLANEMAIRQGLNIMDMRTFPDLDKKDYDILCTSNSGLPHAYRDSPVKEEDYVDSIGIGELEIDLENCNRYSAMTPSEHKAYLKWCDKNRHSQPSKINCVYVSSAAAIHLYRKQAK